MIWQSPNVEPVYHHQIIRQMYVDAMQKFYISRSLVGPIAKLIWLWIFFIGPVFTLPILMAFFYLPYNFSFRQLGERSRFLLIVFVVFVSGLLVEVYQAPHYQAPATCLFIALLLLCMRRLRAWQWHDRPSGLFLMRAIPLICVISFLLRVAAGALHIPVAESHAAAWFQQGPPTFGRAELARQLEHSPGQKLVIVRYENSHRPFEEWVYNGANIDAAKVVWAHAMSPLEDQQLIDSFPDRQALLWEPDQSPPRMSPYLPAGALGSPGSSKQID
jgi:hypothetical protein